MKVKKVQKKKKYVRVESGFSKYRNEILGLIVFAFGVLSFFSFTFTKSMGVFGQAITKILLGFFGATAFFIPIVLIVYGIAMIFKRNEKHFNVKILYTCILLVLVSGFLQTANFDYDEYSGRSFVNSISKFYIDGSNIVGGGVLGGLISLPFLMTFQVLGTVIILGTMSMIVIILLTNFSIASLLRSLSSYTSNKVNIAKEARKQRKEERLKDTLEEDISDLDDFEFEPKKKNKIINFKIERENRSKDKEAEAKENEKSATDKKDSVTLAADKATAGQQKEEQEEFIVGLTGFFDEADDLVVTDVKEMKAVPPVVDDEVNYLRDENGNSNTVGTPRNDRGNSNAAGTQQNGNGEQSEAITEIVIPEKPVVPYKYPPIDLLDMVSDDISNVRAMKNVALEGAKKLEDTLKSFGVEARVINISRGPAVTRYELQPSPGVKVSKIVNLSDDIALNLAAAGVRIEAPIPGKAAVGIEVPNKEMSPVSLREILESREFVNHPSKVTFSVGKDISGETVVADIAKMPHLLVAGATGSGKSVCINSLIMSILFKASPEEVKLLMVDPKVVELGIYNGIPHLLIPVVTDPKKAAGALNWAVQEMVNRYKLFADKGVRDLKGYNAQLKANGEEKLLPQVVIIVDELADLMMVAPNDVEDAICRLAQMARAAGMHLVIATQRPSVDVITGVIKANIPSRVSFAVSSQVDSRTILDMGGAEKLLGKGDMLFYPVGEPKPLRVKGSFVSDAEVERVVDFIKNQGATSYDENIIEKINDGDIGHDNNSGDNDELLNQAIEMVVDAGQASVSLVQRKFKVGYSRAARIIDQMEARNIVGRFEGSKPRQVLITKQQWMEMQMADKNRG